MGTVPLSGGRRAGVFLLLVAALLAMVMPGLANSRAKLTPVAHAAAAKGIAVTVTPQRGPAGSTTSLSATGFNASLVGQVVASIEFDRGALIDKQRLVLCTSPNSPSLSAGFGVDCDGNAVSETVPTDANLGPHQFIVSAGDFGGAAPFEVTIGDTATPTGTATASSTVTAAAAISATDTSTPSMSATAAASASGTPSPTVTSTAAPRPSPTATATRATHPPIALPTFAAPPRLFRLSRTAPPLTFTLDLLRRLAPGAAIVTIPDQAGPHILAAYDHARLLAYVDLISGNAALFPVLPEPGATNAGGNGVSAAQALPRARSLLPTDATQARLGAPIHAIAASSTSGSPTGTSTLTFIPVLRSVDSYPVYGPGSSMALAFGGDGSLRGFARRWRTATAAGTIADVRPAGEVLRAIAAQLANVGAGLPVSIDSIAVVDYDGDNQYMEPAYRFTATVHTPGGLHDDHVIGYEPVSLHEPEPLPALTGGAISGGFKRIGGVGTFIVAGPMRTWSNSAAGFQQGIDSFWPRITGQWRHSLVASPSAATASIASARQFVRAANSVTLLESEAPGGNGVFTTDRYCCSQVHVQDLPALGVAYWIAHTPAFIPPPAGASGAASPWLHLFGGLHTIAGFQSAIYSNDGMLRPYGADLAMGAPVVSAWLLESAADTAYTQGNVTGQGGAAAPRLGQPSTVSVCGHANDTMFDTASLRPPVCILTWGVAK